MKNNLASCGSGTLGRARRASDSAAGLPLFAALVILLIAGWLALPAAARAQSSDPKPSQAQGQGTEGSKQQAAQSETKAQPEDASQPEPKNTRKVYPVRNGNATYERIEETEHKKTADGEIETQRVRMPSYSGDTSVFMEREIHTKKLPDGSIQKETILKNPDGSGRMVPIEVTREKITKIGDANRIQREVLRPDYNQNFTVVRKETVNEKGPEAARQATKEVQEKNIDGKWQVVDRQYNWDKKQGDTTESHSVRQLPDAYGRLSDYEVRDEKTRAKDGKETRETTVRRRDAQDTDHPKFLTIEHTVSEQKKSADGKVTTKSTTESDLLAGGASRNLKPGGPQVVQEKTEVETPGKGGTTRKEVTVKDRGVVDPRVRTSYKVTQETDRDGHVRQIFIPAN